MPKKTIFVVTGLWLLATQVCNANSTDLDSQNLKAKAKSSMNFQSDNILAKKLLSTAVISDTGNTVICPFSAASALTVLANGAVGTTRSQILNTLSDKQDLSSLNMRYASFARGSEFQIANGIFSNSSTPFKSDFLTLCKRDFNVEAQNYGSNPVSVEAINKWCRDKTHGKISSIIDQPLPSVGFVLLNAIYFKGTWLTPFSRAATRNGIFHSENGNITVPMMNKQISLNYAKQKEFSLIELPYSDKKVSLFILLPDTGSNLLQMEKSLLTQNFKKIFDSVTYTEVAISLPRFKIESAHDLKSSLINLGMTDAFSAATANFANLTSTRVAVESIIQKVFFEIDEKGTEAAAVTAPVTFGTGGPPAEVKPINFQVDHPFLALMVEKTTGEILFVAKVAKPG